MIAKSLHIYPRGFFTICQYYLDLHEDGLDDGMHGPQWGF